jgi:DtxR family Mn-dependent transcriptional regulator
MKKKKAKKLSSNLEDYLEAIVMLKEKKGVVRVSDISTFLAVKKSSVSEALGVLAGKRLLIHKRYGKIILTRKGFQIAKDIQKKHKFLAKFFSTILGVTPEIAAEDACKIEHCISPEGFNRLTKFLEFVKNPAEGQKPEWLEEFHCYCESGNRKN